MILDLENWSAQGATAELLRKRLSVRLSFRLANAPAIRSIGTIGKGNTEFMVPTMLAVEYSKMNGGPWEVSALRTYGNLVSDPSKTAVNIYPHEAMYNTVIPAWIRDAAYAGMPDRKEETGEAAAS